MLIEPWRILRPVKLPPLILAGDIGSPWGIHPRLHGIRDGFVAQKKPVIAVDIVQTDAAGSGSNLTTYTFSNLALGPAAADRIIIVGVGGGGTTQRTVNAVTVAGSAATEQVENQSAGTGSTAIYTIALAAGTTGNVVVTFSGGYLRAGVIVWAMTGAGSITASATASDSTHSGNVMAANINVPANGGAVGVARAAFISGNNWTWAGLAEDADITTESPNRLSGAHNEFATAQSPLAVTASANGDISGETMCLASWGPA